jgi:hypothetical protein
MIKITEETIKKLEWGSYRKVPLFVSASEMKGKKGDYLIKGIKGEYYPCDVEVFEESYEPSPGWKDIDIGKNEAYDDEL